MLPAGSLEVHLWPQQNIGACSVTLDAEGAWVVGFPLGEASVCWSAESATVMLVI